MRQVYLSSCKKFTAFKRAATCYAVIRVDGPLDNDVVGLIMLFENGTPLGRWMFDPFLTPLSQTDLLDISGLIGDIKDDHNNDLDKP